MNKTAYDADFYGWASEQAALLCEGRLNEADIANIAEEIESMGRSETTARAYREATVVAGDAIKPGKSVFPVACPWAFEDIIKPGYWPE